MPRRAKFIAQKRIIGGINQTTTLPSPKRIQGTYFHTIFIED